VGYYDSKENVNEYISLAEGYDGRELIRRLREFLSPGSTVLELGMGPGKDLDILAETYTVTGSDASEVFLELYREDHPDADVLKLGAVTIEVNRSFDCIYSNKVLYHLSTAELQTSLRRQHTILNDHGIIMHTFWRGSGTERQEDLLFTYYTEDDIQRIIGESYETLVLEPYSEMDADDSLLLIARRR
jgi:cyclopropane fatty-acyl-phospholipid synthase-like methyltransferase